MYHQRFKSTDERFSEKYRVNEINGCWEWISGGEYPKFWNGHGFQRSTRFIWERIHGVVLIPSQHLCHKCDNALCVNPEHLFVSDHLGNMQDKARKGRSSRLRGNKNGRAKITGEIAEKIREEYFSKSISQESLAMSHGISQSVVSAIITRKCWL